MLILTMTVFPSTLVRAAKHYLTARGCVVKTTRSDRGLSAYRGHELTPEERDHLEDLEAEYDSSPASFYRSHASDGD